jgi:hypothetical protein
LSFIYAKFRYAEVENVVKKAVIVVSLVEESTKVANKKIQKDVLNQLSEEPSRIPWLKEVQKVTVTEE